MQKAVATPGGNKLKYLRERAKKSQFMVELEAELGTGYLQRVESGKVSKPERETLERILTALAATYTERKEVLESFSYIVKVPPPSEVDIAWAVSVCQTQLQSVAFPAYVLDCAQRFLAYNHCFEKLVANRVNLAKLIGTSLFEAWFQPYKKLTNLIENPTQLQIDITRALWYEAQRYLTEDWYKELIASYHQLPKFGEYWQLAINDTTQVVASRPFHNIGIKDAEDDTVLYFRLSSEAFIKDSRFRLVYYLPASVEAINRCAEWTG